MSATTTPPDSHQSTAGREQIGIWDDARDTAFFSIIRSLFPGDFLFGAGVMLALNDDASAS